MTVGTNNPGMTMDQTGNDTIAGFVAQLQKEENDRSDKGDDNYMNDADLRDKKKPSVKGQRQG